MTNESQRLILKAIDSQISNWNDNLYRSMHAIPESERGKEYGESGRTGQEIIDEYKSAVDEFKTARKEFLVICP